MSGEIASLLVKLGLDATGFSTGLDKAGQQTDAFAKKTSLIGTAAKAGFLGLSAGFAIATKGAAQAEEAQGKFMAATGASRDQAKQFVSGLDSIAGSAGTVGKSFDDIAAAGTMVQQQFGTSGQATTDLTEKVLEFSKVTSQDATGAAADLEDTLSAYGKSADDAGGFMDQLVASSQKFGTQVGPDQLAVLRNMEPALTAVGGSLDDGVGFLNLFEAAGLDASKASTGLTKAVAGLKPGQTLDDLIAQIGSIQDPLERAQAAAKLFGTKAGPALAAAIKPGMTSLDDFKISAQEASDKTTQAASDMMTTGDKFQAFADKLMAGAREVGQNFGPLIMGLGSVGSLVAPFAKKFAGLGAPVAKAFGNAFSNKVGSFLRIGSDVGSRLAGKLAAPLTNALSGAFMKLAGDSKIGGAMDKLGGFMGGRLGSGMATAFKAAGILALIAVAIDEWGKLQQQIDANKKAAAGIDTETGNYLAGMPSPQDVQAKIDALKQVPDKLTGIQGALYSLGKAGEGNVIGSVFDTLFGANPAQVADDKIKQMEDYLKGQGTQNVQDGLSSIVDAVTSGKEDVSTAFDQYVQTFEDGSSSLEIAGLNLAGRDDITSKWDLGPDIAAAGADTQAAVQAWIDKQNAAVQDGTDTLGQSLQDMATTVSNKLQGVQDAFDLGIDTKAKKNVSGADRLKQMAKDIDTITKNLHDSIAANDPVNTAYWESALITAQNKYKTASDNIGVSADQVTADLQAAGVSMSDDWTKIGKDAKKGANKVNTAADSVNTNPMATDVSNTADDVHDSFKYAGNSAKAVPANIEDHVDDARRAAQDLANAVTNPVSNIPSDLYSYGEHGGSQFVNGLSSNTRSLSSVANHWAHLLENKLGFSAPPPEGPLHNLPTWGPHMVELWTKTTLSKARVAVPAASKYLALLMSKHLFLGRQSKAVRDTMFNWLSDLGAGTNNAKLTAQIAQFTKAMRHAHLQHKYGDTARPVHHDVPPLPWHHRHRGNGIGDPTPVNPYTPDPGSNDTGSGITVNVTVKGDIYGQGGIKQLAQDLENYLNRTQRGGRRYVGAF